MDDPELVILGEIDFVIKFIHISFVEDKPGMQKTGKPSMPGLAKTSYENILAGSGVSVEPIAKGPLNLVKVEVVKLDKTGGEKMTAEKPTAEDWKRAREYIDVIALKEGRPSFDDRVKEARRMQAETDRKLEEARRTNYQPQ